MTGVYHHNRLIFVFLVETGFLRVGQAGLELLTSGDPPPLASQSAGITGVSHGAWHHTVTFEFVEQMSICHCTNLSGIRRSLEKCELGRVQ